MTRRSRNVSRVIAVAGWCWLAVVIALLWAAALAEGAEAQTPAAIRAAGCRVHNQLPRFSNVGSGTLIDVAPDRRTGLVLTCAHLFAEGTGQVVVEFPGGKSHGAEVVAVDREADLAALAIANPAVAPVPVAAEFRNDGVLRACGYGPRGRYRCAEGRVMGAAATTGQQSVLIHGAVRQGDSGGGVFDEAGNLVAVVWGEAAGVTYASHGAPLRRFLNRVLGDRIGATVACPDGTCPRPAVPGYAPRPRAPAGDRAADNARWQELLRRVSALETEKRGDWVTRDALEGYVRRSEADQLAATFRRQMENLATRAAAGCRCPVNAADEPSFGGPSWRELAGRFDPIVCGALAAGAAGGWLVVRLGKRLASGAGGRRDEPFRDDEVGRVAA